MWYRISIGSILLCFCLSIHTLYSTQKRTFCQCGQILKGSIPMNLLCLDVAAVKDIHRFSKVCHTLNGKEMKRSYWARQTMKSLQLRFRKKFNQNNYSHGSIPNGKMTTEQRNEILFDLKIINGNFNHDMTFQISNT